MTAEPTKDRQFAEAIPADSINIVESQEDVGALPENEPVVPSQATEPDVEEPQVAESHATESQVAEPKSESQTAEPAESVAPPAFSSSSYVPTYANGHYSSEPFGHFSSQPSKKRSFLSKYLPDLKQAFNAVYFLIAALSILSLSGLWNLPPLALLSALFLTFTLAAAYFSVSKSARMADFAIVIPTKLRKQMRLSAIITPIPLIVVAALLYPAHYELQLGTELNAQKKYQDAIPHLIIATVLSPMSGPAFDALAYSYNRTNDRISALSAAERALTLKPNDSEALAQKSWAQDAMGQHESAVQTALASTALDPNNGIAVGALAYAYYNSGQYDLALVAATRHIQLHKDEATAYDLRAKIFDSLGRTEEAALDRNRSNELFEEMMKSTTSSVP